MTPVYLCDDDPAWLARMKAAITKYQIKTDWDFSIACCTASPDALLSCMKEAVPYCGIYFLDVDLKAPINGMKLGEEIRKLDSSPFLIYVTIHEDMMRESFRRKLMALDFIIKDQGCPEEQLFSCMQHVERLLSAGNPTRVCLRINGSLTNFARTEILYARSVKKMHKVIIHTETGLFHAPVTLHALYEELGDGFIFCDKSCIVNISRIASLSPAAKNLRLDNGEILSCSLRQWREIIRAVK